MSLPPFQRILTEQEKLNEQAIIVLQQLIQQVDQGRIVPAKIMSNISEDRKRCDYTFEFHINFL